MLKDRGRDDIKIALVGQGREKPKLEARARSEGLNNILFLDPIPKVELAGLMTGADIGLQILRNVPAFYYGTSPNKFFDYVSAGLPVLNNYPGWLADIIVENDCGFTVAADDADEFASALIKAADDRDALAQKALNARNVAVAKFSRERLSSEWVDWITNQENAANK